MTTVFSLLLNLCCLTQREAADFLRLSASSVDKMSRGVRSAPAGIIDELRSLHRRQRLAADAILDQIDKAAPTPDRIELGLATDDHEAGQLGWPCVGAQAGCFALVVAGSNLDIAIVPRGSAPASAAAADRHDKAL